MHFHLNRRWKNLGIVFRTGKVNYPNILLTWVLPMMCEHVAVDIFTIKDPNVWTYVWYSKRKIGKNVKFSRFQFLIFHWLVIPLPVNWEIVRFLPIRCHLLSNCDPCLPRKRNKIFARRCTCLLSACSPSSKVYFLQCNGLQCNLQCNGPVLERKL